MRVVGISLALAALVAGALLLAALAGVFDSAGASDLAPEARATATVARRDLVQRRTVSGTLGFADPREIVNYRRGTITLLPEEGRIVHAGAVLYRVNEQPVVLLAGGQPAWRALGPGVSDGSDIRQLEQNLRALGYDASQELTIDRRFTTATAGAVERWQEAIGLPRTGRVELGVVVFLSGPRRLGTVRGGLGDPARPGAPIILTSSTERVVTASIDARDQADIAVGDDVLLDLLNGTTTTGTITEVGKVASLAVESSEGGPNASSATTATITFEVRPDRPSATGRLEQAPVEVQVTSERAADALSVPVGALLALSGGRYGLELVRDRSTDVVPIVPGLYSDGGYVEIERGRVRVGDLVVVPS